VAPGLVGGVKAAKDKTVMKGFRSLIKNKMVFPSFFGATNESVHGYLVNATKYEVEQSIVDDLMEEFWSTFNGMSTWQKNTMKHYYDEGFVETLSGRKHRYPLTKNQAVNMPIQGTAAELVCDAMCRLSHMALSTGQLHLHPILNIHDDLSFFIPDNDKIIENALETITREMLVFDFPWINVPLSVEISIGPNWADVSPIDKIWSHKAYGYPHK
jgi:DNA polymerase-1